MPCVHRFKGKICVNHRKNYGNFCSSLNSFDKNFNICTWFRKKFLHLWNAAQHDFHFKLKLVSMWDTVLAVYASLGVLSNGMDFELTLICIKPRRFLTNVVDFLIFSFFSPYDGFNSIQVETSNEVFVDRCHHVHQYPKKNPSAGIRHRYSFLASVQLFFDWKSHSRTHNSVCIDLCANISLHPQTKNVEIKSKKINCRKNANSICILWNKHNRIDFNLNSFY